jgi:lipopolysaccharide heptosyltransferase I
VSTPLAARPFERILLIKPSAFGDVLHAVPVLVKLRARYPQARIDWLVTPENAELVRYHPALSNVVLFSRREYVKIGRDWSAGSRLIDLLNEIWRTRYDLVIDLHGQFRSTVFALVSGAPVRIGFDRPRSAGAVNSQAAREVGVHGWRGAREGSWMAYSHHIPIPTLDVHAIDRYLWLAPMLGLDDGPPDMRVYWPAEADDSIDRLLADEGLAGRSFAILAPTTIWQTKHWRVEGFAEVGRHLLSDGVAVVLAGTPTDRPRCEAVRALCPGAVNLAGRTTLAEYAALMNRACLAVTNDSGSMHLAVALGRPVVSVFGPTNADRIGPYGRRHAAVQADVPCAGCYLKRLRDCPHDHACMNQVTAAMVIERLQSVLAAPSTPPLPAARRGA